MSAPAPACGFDALAPDARFRSRGRTITEADVVGFSALTGDWHPQHADAEWAASSRFGERLAHGLLTVSYALGLIQLDPAWVVALRRLGPATFRQPVRIGDTIHVEARIETLRPVDERLGLVTIHCKVVRHDEVVAVSFAAEVLWARARRATGEHGGER